MHFFVVVFFTFLLPSPFLSCLLLQLQHQWLSRLSWRLCLPPCLQLFCHLCPSFCPFSSRPRPPRLPQESGKIEKSVNFEFPAIFPRAFSFVKKVNKPSKNFQKSFHFSGLRHQICCSAFFLTCKTCQWMTGRLGLSTISAQCFFSNFLRL